MNRFLKDILIGAIFALTIILVHLYCCILTETNMPMGYTYTSVIFAIMMVAFLTSKKLSDLLIKGIVALFLMFYLEISFLLFYANTLPNYLGQFWFIAYFSGLKGSLYGIPVAIIITLLKIKTKDVNIMTKSQKRNLIVYFIASASTASYLLLPEKSGIGAFLFTLIQAVMLFFFAPDRKRLWLFVPVIVFGLNAFVSANTMWRIPNIFVSVLVYSIVFLDLKNLDFISQIRNISERIFYPAKTCRLPLIWLSERKYKNSEVVKKILIASAFTVPAVVILTMVLSGADMVFGKEVSQGFENFFNILTPSKILLGVLGILIGLYLFGILHAAYSKSEPKNITCKKINGDTLIINIFLTSILVVYTAFTIIQFRYLFAGADTLPYDLSYTEYARKGFFELLALSVVNIAIILFIAKITEENKFGYTKFLCVYLCAVTFVLLMSSFYRMWLYNADDGLTRMRFMVFGFLVFEAVGLLITFVYILKPKFRITTVYFALAITYYSLLNLVPMDMFIAQNQINMYNAGKRPDLTYVLTLSPDAAYPVSQLDDINGYRTTFFENFKNKNTIPKRWQRFNVSSCYADQLCKIYCNNQPDT